MITTTHASHQQDRATDDALDVQRIREDFPILHQTLHGKPLAYLDNAASAQKPRQVIDAVVRHYERDNANIHRGVHTLSVRATKAYEDARDKLRRFIGAPRREEIIFVRGATEGINLVAQSYARPLLKPGDEIVVTTMEHHSNIVPWQLVCEQTGALLRVAPINDDGEVILEQLEQLLGARTKLLAVTHVSNSLGTINPIREMIDMAHARDVCVLVDGAQAAPHMNIDVQALGCDFYVLSSHKMFGPTGVGVLYGRFDLLEKMPPYQGGGEMIQSVTFEKTTYNDLPFKFEAGTPNIAGSIGLGAAVDYLQSVGMDRIVKHEEGLLSYANQALTEVPGLRQIGTARNKVAVVSFVLEGVHAHDVGTILDHEGVAVRTGHHCTQPVMDRYGVSATTRASFAFYNTRAEVDALVQGLHKVVETFGA